MYGETASTNRTRWRSVSKPIGDRRPISAYLPATGIDLRDEINFASGLRRKPSGPMGIMSGSRNRFSKNGSTACNESGPPSWNNTIPTRFFPAMLLASVVRILQPLDLFTQCGSAPRHRDIKHKKDTPADHVRRKQAVEIFHATSHWRRIVSTSPRMASSRYRWRISNVIKASIANHMKN